MEGIDHAQQDSGRCHFSTDEMNSYKGSSDQARWNESFKTADSDGDGRVPKQELTAHHSSKRGATDPSMDVDTGTTRRSTTTSTTTTGADTDKPDGTSPQ
jgi:hypothetical protein